MNAISDDQNGGDKKIGAVLRYQESLQTVAGTLRTSRTGRYEVMVVSVNMCSAIGLAFLCRYNAGPKERWGSVGGGHFTRTSLHALRLEKVKLSSVACFR
jgi:hypothetical protein